jgi:hypothetical protein
VERIGLGLLVQLDITDWLRGNADCSGSSLARPGLPW